MNKKRSTPESIKSELNSILQLNVKRKAAIEKISKNIVKDKSNIKQLNEDIKAKSSLT